ncbi:MAG: LysR family transcriptional regulator [Zoogloea sp.]|uniref:LysR family transcriptional regulator n=1 Tax=Zoogloea sp. TaxID=49181 RepID=UPI003F2D714B
MPWLNEWKAFVKTAEGGSMAAAARKLDCSRALVSKQLADLEQHLGARLFERTTRKLNLTPAGEVFYQHACQVLEAVEQAELAVHNLAETPRGLLRISASVAFGRLYIAPLLPEITRRHPALRCELMLSDQAADLAEEKVDVALRLTSNPPDHVIARELTTLRRVICASPAYLATHGHPRLPADLSQHQCFTFITGRPDPEWHLRGTDGEISVAVDGKVQVNNIDAIYEAVCAGHGLALLPTYLVQPALNDGRLVSVLADWQPVSRFGRAVYACYLPSRARLPALRVFLDALNERFHPRPPWENLMKPNP